MVGPHRFWTRRVISAARFLPVSGGVVVAIGMVGIAASWRLPKPWALRTVLACDAVLFLSAFAIWLALWAPVTQIFKHL